jgi:type IV pilus assembly protein PilV
MRNEKGFTLLEVMIGLLILAVGLLAVAGLTTMIIKTNAYGNHLTEASTIAQAKMEEFRTTHPAAGNGSDTVEGVTGARFTRKWAVTPKGEMKIITVTVEWADITRHSIELSTIIG